MTPNKIKQQKVLAYILLGCSLVLLPTKTVIGVVFLIIASLTLWQSKGAESNSET